MTNGLYICDTCANRGKVNGLSQDMYCKSCIYEGAHWRQNHYVSKYQENVDTIQFHVDGVEMTGENDDI